MLQTHSLCKLNTSTKVVLQPNNPIEDVQSNISVDDVFDQIDRLIEKQTGPLKVDMGGVHQITNTTYHPENTTHTAHHEHNTTSNSQGHQGKENAKQQNTLNSLPRTTSRNKNQSNQSTENRSNWSNEKCDTCSQATHDQQCQQQQYTITDGTIQQINQDGQQEIKCGWEERREKQQDDVQVTIYDMSCFKTGKEGQKNRNNSRMTREEYIEQRETCTPSKQHQDRIIYRNQRENVQNSNYCVHKTFYGKDTLENQWRGFADVLENDHKIVHASDGRWTSQYSEQLGMDCTQVWELSDFLNAPDTREKFMLELGKDLVQISQCMPYLCESDIEHLENQNSILTQVNWNGDACYDINKVGNHQKLQSPRVFVNQDGTVIVIHNCRVCDGIMQFQPKDVDQQKTPVSKIPSSKLSLVDSSPNDKSINRSYQLMQLALVTLKIDAAHVRDDQRVKHKVLHFINDGHCSVLFDTKDSQVVLNMNMYPDFHLQNENSKDPRKQQFYDQSVNYIRKLQSTTRKMYVKCEELHRLGTNVGKDFSYYQIFTTSLFANDQYSHCDMREFMHVTALTPDWWSSFLVGVIIRNLYIIHPNQVAGIIIVLRNYIMTMDLQLFLKLIFLRSTMLKSLKTGYRKSRADLDSTFDTFPPRLFTASVFTEERPGCVYDLFMYNMAERYTRIYNELKTSKTCIDHIDAQWNPVAEQFLKGYQQRIDKKTLCDFMDIAPHYFSALGCMDEVDFWAHLVAPNFALNLSLYEMSRDNASKLKKEVRKRANAVERQIKLVLTAMDCRIKPKYHEKHYRENNPFQLILCLQKGGDQYHHPALAQHFRILSECVISRILKLQCDSMVQAGFGTTSEVKVCGTPTNQPVEGSQNTKMQHEKNHQHADFSTVDVCGQCISQPNGSKFTHQTSSLKYIKTNEPDFNETVFSYQSIRKNKNVDVKEKEEPSSTDMKTTNQNVDPKDVIEPKVAMLPHSQVFDRNRLLNKNKVDSRQQSIVFYPDSKTLCITARGNVIWSLQVDSDQGDKEVSVRLVGEYGDFMDHQQSGKSPVTVGPHIPIFQDEANIRLDNIGGVVINSKTVSTITPYLFKSEGNPVFYDTSLFIIGEEQSTTNCVLFASVGPYVAVLLILLRAPKRQARQSNTKKRRHIGSKDFLVFQQLQQLVCDILSKQYEEQYTFDQIELIQAETADAFVDYLDAQNVVDQHYYCLRFVHKLLADVKFNNFRDSKGFLFLESQCNLNSLLFHNASFTMDNGFRDPTFALSHRLSGAKIHVTKEITPLFEKLDSLLLSGCMSLCATYLYCKDGEILFNQITNVGGQRQAQSAHLVGVTQVCHKKYFELLESVPSLMRQLQAPVISQTSQSGTFTSKQMCTTIQVSEISSSNVSIDREKCKKTQLESSPHEAKESSDLSFGQLLKAEVEDIGASRRSGKVNRSVEHQHNGKTQDRKIVDDQNAKGLQDPVDDQNPELEENAKFFADDAFLKQLSQQYLRSSIRIIKRSFATGLLDYSACSDSNIMSVLKRLQEATLDNAKTADVFQLLSWIRDSVLICKYTKTNFLVLDHGAPENLIPETYKKDRPIAIQQTDKTTRICYSYYETSSCVNSSIDYHCDLVNLSLFHDRQVACVRDSDTHLEIRKPVGNYPGLSSTIAQSFLDLVESKLRNGFFLEQGIGRPTQCKNKTEAKSQMYKQNAVDCIQYLNDNFKISFDFVREQFRMCVETKQAPPGMFRGLLSYFHDEMDYHSSYEYDKTPVKIGNQNTMSGYQYLRFLSGITMMCDDMLKQINTSNKSLFKDTEFLDNTGGQLQQHIISQIETSGVLTYTAFSNDARIPLTMHLAEYLRHTIMERRYKQLITIGDFSDIIGKVERDFKNTTVFNNSSFDLQPRLSLTDIKINNGKTSEFLSRHVLPCLGMVIPIVFSSSFLYATIRYKDMFFFKTNSWSIFEYTILGESLISLATSHSMFHGASDQVIDERAKQQINVALDFCQSAFGNRQNQENNVKGQYSRWHKRINSNIRGALEPLTNVQKVPKGKVASVLSFLLNFTKTAFLPSLIYIISFRLLRTIFRLSRSFVMSSSFALFALFWLKQITAFRDVKSRINNLLSVANAHGALRQIHDNNSGVNRDEYVVTHTTRRAQFTEMKMCSNVSVQGVQITNYGVQEDRAKEQQRALERVIDRAKAICKTMNQYPRDSDYIFYDHYARLINGITNRHSYKHYEEAMLSFVPRARDLSQDNGWFTDKYWERSLHLAILVDLSDQRMINYENLDPEFYIPEELVGDRNEAFYFRINKHKQAIPHIASYIVCSYYDCVTSIQFRNMPETLRSSREDCFINLINLRNDDQDIRIVDIRDNRKLRVFFDVDNSYHIMDLSTKLPGVCKDSMFFVDTEFRAGDYENGLYSIQMAVYSPNNKRTTSMHLLTTFNPETRPSAQQLVREFHEFLKINNQPTLCFWDKRQDLKMLKLQNYPNIIDLQMEFSIKKTEAIGDHYTSDVLRVGLNTATATVLDRVQEETFDYQNPNFDSLIRYGMSDVQRMVYIYNSMNKIKTVDRQFLHLSYIKIFVGRQHKSQWDDIVKRSNLNEIHRPQLYKGDMSACPVHKNQAIVYGSYKDVMDNLSKENRGKIQFSILLNKSEPDGESCMLQSLIMTVLLNYPAYLYNRKLSIPLICERYIMLDWIAGLPSYDLCLDQLIHDDITVKIQDQHVAIKDIINYMRQNNQFGQRTVFKTMAACKQFGVSVHIVTNHLPLSLGGALAYLKRDRQPCRIMVTQTCPAFANGRIQMRQQSTWHAMAILPKHIMRVLANQKKYIAKRINQQRTSRHIGLINSYSEDKTRVQCCKTADIILESVMEYEPVLRKQAQHRYEYDTYNNSNGPHVSQEGSTVMRQKFHKAVSYYKDIQRKIMDRWTPEKKQIMNEQKLIAWSDRVQTYTRNSKGVELQFDKYRSPIEQLSHVETNNVFPMVNSKQSAKIKKMSQRMEQDINSAGTMASQIGPSYGVPVDCGSAKLVRKLGIPVFSERGQEHVDIVHNQPTGFASQLNSTLIRAAQANINYNAKVREQWLSYMEQQLTMFFTLYGKVSVHPNLIDYAIEKLKVSNKPAKDRDRIIDKLEQLKSRDIAKVPLATLLFQSNMVPKNHTFSFFLKREIVDGQKATNRNITPLAEDFRSMGVAEFEAITEVLERFVWDSFVKHCTPFETNQKMCDAVAIAETVLAADYSKFDATIQRDLHEIEFTAMNMIFSGLYNPSFVQCNDIPSYVQGTNFDYLCPTSRKSGVLMTGLGNTLFNYFMFNFAFEVLGYDRQRLMTLIVEGDDSLVGVNQSHGDEVDQIIKTITKAGLNATSEVSSAPRQQRSWIDSQANFVGNQYISDPTCCFSVPDPYKSLRKLGFDASHSIPSMLIINDHQILHYKSMELIFIRLFSFVTSYRLPRSGVIALLDSFSGYFNLKEPLLKLHASRRMQEKYDKLKRNVIRLCNYTLDNDKLEIYDLLKMLQDNGNSIHKKLLQYQKWQIQQYYQHGRRPLMHANEANYIKQVRAYYDVYAHHLIQEYVDHFFQHYRTIFPSVSNVHIIFRKFAGVLSLNTVDSTYTVEQRDGQQFISLVQGKFKDLWRDDVKETIQFNSTAWQYEMSRQQDVYQCKMFHQNVGFHARMAQDGDLKFVKQRVNPQQRDDFPIFKQQQKPKCALVPHQSIIQQFLMNLSQFTQQLNSIPIEQQLKITEHFEEGIRKQINQIGPDITRLNVSGDGMTATGGSLQGYDIFGGVPDVLKYYIDMPHQAGTKTIYVIHVKSTEDLNEVKKILGYCAVAPAIIHINSVYYGMLLKSTSRAVARSIIKPINTHNDKMGFNWSVAENKWVSSLTLDKGVIQADQFDDSSYRQLMSGVVGENFNGRYGKRDDVLKASKQRGGDNQQQIPFQKIDVSNIQAYQQQTYQSNQQQPMYRADQIASGLAEDVQKQLGAFDHCSRVLQGVDANDAYVRSAYYPEMFPARIPQLEPTPTVCLTDKQDLNIIINPNNQGVKNAIMMVDFQAGMARPIAFIDDLPAQFFNDKFSSKIEFAGQDGISSQYQIATMLNTGKTLSALTDDSVISEYNQLNQVAHQIRLVSASFNLQKTSKADTESGRLRVLYNRRRNNIRESLEQILDGAMGQPYYFETNTVGDFVPIRGRYRPTKLDEVENFSDTRCATYSEAQESKSGSSPYQDYVTANHYFDLDLDSANEGINLGTPQGTGNGDYVHRYYQSFFGPFQATAFGSTEKVRYVSANTDQNATVHLDAASMMRPHTVLFVFENCTRMNFTITLHRNFEAVPSGVGKYLAQDVAQLEGASNALELLRDARLVPEQSQAIDQILNQIDPLQRVQLQQHLKVFGLLDGSFFQRTAQNIKNLAKAVSHSDLFKKILPLVIRGAAKRFSVPDKVVNEVFQILS